MSQIASKNLYELLGNDPELDPDREPEPPTQVIDKPVARTGKRNAAETAAKDTPRPAAGGRGGRNDNVSRGDQAGLNSRENRNREPREYRGEGRGEGRGRGGRGRGEGRGRGRGGPRDDRHSHTGVGEQQKQAAHGWGNEQNASAEWADERAGDAIASAEATNDAGFTPDTAGGDPAFSNGPDGGEIAAEEAAPEPEDKTKSYEQYLAELAEKRLALSGNTVNVRKANEGSSQKFPTGKAFSRDPEAEMFMAGTGGKPRKTKDTQDKKERVVMDSSYYTQPDTSSGRGGGRGRGGRGRGEGRGEFRGRGDRRGRGGDFREGARGGRDNASSAGFNANDDSAFPALGA